jgi:hypothetical protein
MSCLVCFEDKTKRQEHFLIKYCGKLGFMYETASLFNLVNLSIRKRFKIR